MTNEELLKNAGFIEGEGIFKKDLGDGFTIDAILEGDGIIFHLYKDGQLIQPTVNTVEPEDVAEAFKQLTGLLPLLVNIFNRKSSNPEKDFKLAIQLLQTMIKCY